MNPQVMSENSVLERHSRVLTIFAQPTINMITGRSRKYVEGIELVSVEIKKAILEAEQKKAEVLNMLHLLETLR